MITSSYRFAKRLVIGVVGVTVLSIGIALLFLPGPGIIVIPLGLVILSVEFAWARHWLHKLRRKLSQNSIDSIGRRAEKHR